MYVSIASFQISSNIVPNTRQIKKISVKLNTMKQKKSMKRKLFLLKLFGFALIAISLSTTLLYFSFLRNKKLTFVTFQSGEERICWEGGCAWIHVPPLSQMSTIAPSVISSTPTSPITNEIVIGTYKEYPNETYSPLKAAAIGSKYIIYTLRENEVLTTYTYNRATKKTSELFYQGDGESRIYPLILQPQTEEHLLVAHYNSNQGNGLLEFINIEKEKISGLMKFSDVTWNQDSYTARVVDDLDGTEKILTCPYYTNILNCPENTTQRNFEDAFFKFANPLQLNWIALDIPKNWNFNYQDNNLSYQDGIITWQEMRTEDLPKIDLNQYSQQSTKYYDNNKAYQVKVYENPDKSEAIAYVITNKKAIVFTLKTLTADDSILAPEFLQDFLTMTENIVIK
ncbi:MAG: hypothetical protein CO156_04590 [Candidatus Pacebacteria bacterium CG_4_9_14_3_um_filter_40_12]|nr:MAG: hypothetical protein COU64_05635 [Candidatus Pacebacteria bacterium CG10_big_fil_rev_8_21_14_0_10_40_26]PIZ78199.1 MAG: hypothetical protein COY01_05455 [Candidatus Pacebacteria bacterium CG_4_10_14_0_2_um_filter_40_20]PJA68756.1 MAG: hypothetical protein CO156_04590 [Candidatus Pacebacteria bacterium CG_4_9_14_3_um_filter_40_12]PJC41696.1 MAG: hypothetical protein CO041_03180 [Candidatus Pacebacteria bacterium CG_4_9_14_0_2_um_filter_40_15]